MGRYKLKRQRPRAFFGQAAATLTAAGINAAATAAAAALNAKATSDSAKQQSQAINSNAQRNAEALKEQNENNNQLAKENQDFIKEQNAETRAQQKNIQLQLAMLTGQNNEADRLDAAKIQVKNGGSMRKKYQMLPSTGGLNGNMPFRVTDGGGVVPIGFTPEGYNMYEIYGNDHNHYHKTRGKAKTGVGIKFANGKVIEGEGNQKSNLGELLITAPNDAFFLSKHDLRGFNPTRSVLNGMDPMYAFAMQEAIKDKYGIPDSGKYAKRGGKFAAGGQIDTMPYMDTVPDYTSGNVAVGVASQLDPIRMMCGGRFRLRNGGRAQAGLGDWLKGQYQQLLDAYNTGYRPNGTALGNWLRGGAGILNGAFDYLTRDSSLAQSVNNSAYGQLVDKGINYLSDLYNKAAALRFAHLSPEQQLRESLSGKAITLVGKNGKQQTFIMPTTDGDNGALDYIGGYASVPGAILRQGSKLTAKRIAKEAMTHAEKAAITRARNQTMKAVTDLNELHKGINAEKAAYQPYINTVRKYPFLENPNIPYSTAQYTEAIQSLRSEITKKYPFLEDPSIPYSTGEYNEATKALQDLNNRLANPKRAGIRSSLAQTALASSLAQTALAKDALTGKISLQDILHEGSRRVSSVTDNYAKSAVERLHTPEPPEGSIAAARRELNEELYSSKPKVTVNSKTSKAGQQATQEASSKEKTGWFANTKLGKWSDKHPKLSKLGKVTTGLSLGGGSLWLGSNLWDAYDEYRKQGQARNIAASVDSGQKVDNSKYLTSNNKNDSTVNKSDSTASVAPLDTTSTNNNDTTQTANIGETNTKLQLPSASAIKTNTNNNQNNSNTNQSNKNNNTTTSKVNNKPKRITSANIKSAVDGDDFSSWNNFNDAFDRARKQGLKTFKWGNKLYGTVEATGKERERARSIGAKRFLRPRRKTETTTSSTPRRRKPITRTYYSQQPRVKSFTLHVDNGDEIPMFGDANESDSTRTAFKYGGRLKAAGGFNLNNLSYNDAQLIGSGIGALGSIFGTGLNMWANNRANKRLGNAYLNAGNIMADAYRQLQTTDNNLIRPEDYRSAHALAQFQAPIRRNQAQRATINRMYNNASDNIGRNMASGVGQINALNRMNNDRFDRLNQSEEEENKRFDNIANQNAERATSVANENANRDTQSSKGFTDDYLKLKMYTNDIVNQRIIGSNSALADTSTKAADYAAQIGVANANLLGNAVNRIGELGAQAAINMGTHNAANQASFVGMNNGAQTDFALGSEGGPVYQKQIAGKLATAFNNNDISAENVNYLRRLVNVNPKLADLYGIDVDALNNWKPNTTPLWNPDAFRRGESVYPQVNNIPSYAGINTSFIPNMTLANMTSPLGKLSLQGMQFDTNTPMGYYQSLLAKRYSNAANPYTNSVISGRNWIGYGY